MQRFKLQSFTKESLENHTVEELTALLKILSSKKFNKKKAELVLEISKYYDDKDNLNMMWNKLDKIQQLAVAETIYSDSDTFDQNIFDAKYGKQPNWGKELSHYNSWSSTTGTPSPLRLFFLKKKIPIDLSAKLMEFVKKPQSAQIEIITTLPQEISLGSSSNKSVIIEKLKHYYSESEAQKDFISLLRLVATNRLEIGEKTGVPSLTTLKKVSKILSSADFYEEKFFNNDKNYEKLTFIRPFAWIILLQGAGYAKAFGKYLQITKAGEQALAKKPSDIIKVAFTKWLNFKDYDELMRIDKIKGKTGKGKRSLSHPPTRRQILASMLEKCPPNQWINIDEFLRYIKASGITQLVGLDDCWSLYVSDQNYGSLGYADNWSFLEGPWARCLFMEYLSTLGLIDIAYINPHKARNDFRDHWGTDDFDFISQYDGLLYFKINLLGQYCLNLTTEYMPPVVDQHYFLCILENLELSVLEGELPICDEMLIDLFCKKISYKIWRLDKQKFLSHIQNGRPISQFREFLNQKVKTALPKTVEQFLGDIDSNTNALSVSGSARLITCVNENLAKLIAMDSNTKKYCMLANDGILVIPMEYEKKFKLGLKKLGHHYQT